LTTEKTHRNYSTNLKGKEGKNEEEREKSGRGGGGRRHSIEVCGGGDMNQMRKQRVFSTEQWLYSRLHEEKEEKSEEERGVTILTEIDSADFENWKLAINEAISNSLLMFFFFFSHLFFTFFT
jgi:hypothetical protein